MKSTLFAFLFALLSINNALAGNYDESMKTMLDRMVKAGNEPQFGLWATQFNQLIKEAPERWEALYYFNYCRINQAFAAPANQKDALLDETEPIFVELKKSSAPRSEILVLEAMMNQARIGVSPMERGMSYSGKFTALLADAGKADPKNPRVDLIKGLGVMNTPEAFGGGLKNAKPLFESAKSKFASFTLQGELFPSWGESMNDALLKKIQ